MPEPNQPAGSGPQQRIPHGEMIERIQSSQSAGIGASGRKRKRRTRQPKKRRERRRWFLKAVLGMGVAVFGMLVVSLFWHQWRCSSEGFREELSARLTDELGVRVEVGPMELRGLGLTAANIALKGGGGGPLKYGELRRVRAMLLWPSFLGSEWEIKSLTVDEADLHFTFEGGEKAGERVGGAGPRGSRMARIGLSSRPSGWKIEAMQLRSLNLFWDTGSGKSTHSLTESRASFPHFSEGMELHLRGGQFSTDGIGGFELEGADLKLERDRVLIGKAQLTRGAMEASRDESVLEVAGAIDIGGEKMVKLEVGVRKLDLEDVINPSWTKRLGGRFSADLKFEKSLSERSEGEWEGTFFVAEAWIADLAILETMAQSSGESRFRRIQFDDAISGVVRKDEEGIALLDLKAEKTGLLKLSGRIEVGAEEAGRALQGRLKAGLPEGLLNRFSGGKPAVFGEAEGGFSHAEVQLRGRLEYPQEDLSAALMAEAGVKRPGPGKVEEGPRESVPEKVREGEKGPKGEPLNDAEEKARLEELFEALLR